jgi:long-chain acyl-CoA synthetase
VALSSAASRRRGAIVSATTSRAMATKTRSTGRYDETENENDDGRLQFNTLHELVTNATLRYGPNPLFGTFASSSSPHSDAKETTKMTTMGGGGRFEWTTYSHFGREVALARCVLRNMLGVVLPYSKIGIISNNRREWAIIASAAYSLNCSIVPMYENQRCEDWSHILNDSGCIALVCSTYDVYSRARNEALVNVPYISDNDVICLDAPEHEPHSFRGAMARAERELLLLGGGGGGRTTTTTTTTTTNDIPEGLGIVAPSPDDLANLIYTSGTTGKPKGVELVHSNQVSNIKGCRNMSVDVFDFPTSNDTSLAFLPWAHSYGQVSEGSSWIFHPSSPFYSVHGL